MKKIISVLLAVLFLFTASALADPSGTWVQYRKTNLTTRRISTLTLEPDHRAYFSSETFTSSAPESSENYAGTWELDGTVLTVTAPGMESIVLNHVDESILSQDPAGTYGLFFRVPDSGAAYEKTDEEIRAILEERNRPPEPVSLIGKWSFYWDTSTLRKEYRNALGYDLLIYDLYLAENGAVYLATASAEKGPEPSPVAEILSGIWIGSADDISMRLADKTSFKAKMTDDGFLAVYLTDKIPLLFRKVDCTETMNSTIK